MSEVVAIYGDALLDPASGEFTRRAAVLVEGGRVVRTGPRDQMPVPQDARVVDAEGLTLLPGLIDTHVHLYDAISKMRPEAEGSDEIKWNFTKFLVGRDGAVIKRYEPPVAPSDLASDLEHYL